MLNIRELGGSIDDDDFYATANEIVGAVQHRTEDTDWVLVVAEDEAGALRAAHRMARSWSLGQSAILPEKLSGLFEAADNLAAFHDSERPVDEVLGEDYCQGLANTLRRQRPKSHPRVLAPACAA